MYQRDELNSFSEDDNGPWQVNGQMFIMLYAWHAQHPSGVLKFQIRETTFTRRLNISRAAL